MVPGTPSSAQVYRAEGGIAHIASTGMHSARIDWAGRAGYLRSQQQNSGASLEMAARMRGENMKAAIASVVVLIALIHAPES